jgi:hypothetical protein
LRYAPALLVALVLVHFAAQAASALGPRTGARWHETRLWALFACVCWSICLAHATRTTLRAPIPAAARERALSMAERAATAVVLVFALGHGLGFAWRTLSGELLASELRPALIAALSSTTAGVPWPAAAYLSAVGCAAFLVARRAPVVLGLCACALGVYAVVEFATGSLLPW